MEHYRPWPEERTAHGDRARVSTGSSQAKTKASQVSGRVRPVSELGPKKSSVKVGNIRVTLEECEARPCQGMAREETG